MANSIRFQDPLLRELFLLQQAETRWGVLISALDSLRRPIHSIAEIGVYQGLCSRFLRNCFPCANLYLVDPWEACSSYQNSDGPRTTKESDMHNAFNSVKSYFQKDPYTHILKKTSKEASLLVPDELDLVFIDGNHDYEFVKEDIELWMPKVRNGGILAGHDYYSKGDCFPGVQRAVDELLGSSVTIEKGSVWLYTKGEGQL